MLLALAKKDEVWRSEAGTAGLFPPTLLLASLKVPQALSPARLQCGQHAAPRP